MSQQLTEQQRMKLRRMMEATCEACNLTGYLILALHASPDPVETLRSLMHFLNRMNDVFPEGTAQAIAEANALAIELDIDFRAVSMGDIDYKGMVN